MSDIHRTIDMRPVAGVTIDDRDMTLAQRHIATAQERGRYRGPTDAIMCWSLLRRRPLRHRPCSHPRIHAVD